MKYFLIIIFFLITFSVSSSSTNAQTEPTRLIKCCQVTVTATGETQCRERNDNCVKYNSDPEGTYESFGSDSKCSSASTLKTKFSAGKCSGAALSSNSFTDLELVGTKAGFSAEQKKPNAIVDYIGKIIKVALGLTGLIFLIYAIYSGIEWMTAGGNANRVSDARSRLIQAAIGMMITAIAYSAAALIITIIGSQS